MARAAYWSEFREAIKQGMAREILKYDVIEILVFLQIPVRWKEKMPVTRGGKAVGFSWHECLGLAEYKPGEVLHLKRRPASEWEKE